MFRYSLSACIEMFSKGIGCHCLQGDQGHDCPPGRVGNRLKNVSSYFHLYIICNYVVANISAIIWLRNFFSKLPGNGLFRNELKEQTGMLFIIDCRSICRMTITNDPEKLFTARFWVL